MNGRGIAALTVLAAFIAAALITGCGSDSSSKASESSAPLTKAEFVKQAEQVCEREIKAKEKAVTEAAEQSAKQGSVPTAQDLGKVVELAVIPHYSKIVEELSQLSAPRGEEAKVAKLTDELEAALKAIKADPASATTKNPFTPVNATLKAFGIEHCLL